MLYNNFFKPINIIFLCSFLLTQFISSSWAMERKDNEEIFYVSSILNGTRFEIEVNEGDVNKKFINSNPTLDVFCAKLYDDTKDSIVHTLSSGDNCLVVTLAGHTLGEFSWQGPTKRENIENMSLSEWITSKYPTLLSEKEDISSIFKKSRLRIQTKWGY